MAWLQEAAAPLAGLQAALRGYEELAENLGVVDGLAGQLLGRAPLHGWRREGRAAGLVGGGLEGWRAGAELEGCSRAGGEDCSRAGGLEGWREPFLTPSSKTLSPPTRHPY